jgi:hypothetical protein
MFQLTTPGETLILPVSAGLMNRIVRVAGGVSPSTSRNFPKSFTGAMIST